MKRKILHKHSYPYKRYVIDDMGNNKYILTISVIIDNCWKHSFRKKTDSNGLKKLICGIDTSIVEKLFF
jgi:hypothetical protein